MNFPIELSRGIGRISCGRRSVRAFGGGAAKGERRGAVLMDFEGKAGICATAKREVEAVLGAVAGGGTMTGVAPGAAAAGESETLFMSPSFGQLLIRASETTRSRARCVLATRTSEQPTRRENKSKSRKTLVLDFFSSFRFRSRRALLCTAGQTSMRLLLLSRIEYSPRLGNSSKLVRECLLSFSPRATESVIRYKGREVRNARINSIKFQVVRKLIRKPK